MIAPCPRIFLANGNSQVSLLLYATTIPARRCAWSNVPAQHETVVKKEPERIMNVQPGSPVYYNYRQWINGTQLEKKISLEDYSVFNCGLRAGFTVHPHR